MAQTDRADGRFARPSRLRMPEVDSQVAAGRAMADVFISFSSKDAGRVQRIHARLVERGFDVWWMKNIAPGDSTIKTVSRELECAKKVVLAWSRHAAESPYVEGEIMHAFGTRKLLPIRIEKWGWPAFLSSVQYIDMTSLDDETDAWRQLEERLLLKTMAGRARPATAFIAAPRSAGPVRTLAVVMLLLVSGLFWLAFKAIDTADIQGLQWIQYGLFALPVLAGVPVLIAAHRVWAAWRSRPESVRGATT